jgi:hypothetical protein
MRILRWLLPIAAALLLSACEAVFTEQPLGEEVVRLDPAIWQGTWLSDEVVVMTTVLDADQGLLQAAWVERWPDGARFEAVAGTVRRSGDLLFLNMAHRPEQDADSAAPAPQPDDGAPRGVPEFFWARVENDGRRALLWWPDVERARAAVGDGSLPGFVKQDRDVVLRQLSASQLELINAPSSGLLKWSQPATFIRIGD